MLSERDVELAHPEAFDFVFGNLPPDDVAEFNEHLEGCQYCQGVVAEYGDNWELRLMGSNLTDQIGLTEGNARFGGNTAQGGVNFGRSILGREGNIELKYKF